MRQILIGSAIATTLLTLSAPAPARGGFIEDSKANFSLRNFHINQDNRSGPTAPSRTSEWGQGLLLNVQSGYTQGKVGLGLDMRAQMGVRLDSGGRADKTGRSRSPGILLPLNSDGSAVNEFSRLDFTAKARIADTELRVGSLMPALPILTYNDGGLLAQNFRGGQIESREIDRLILHAGQIESARGRASSDYEGLRIAGGSERVNKFHYGGGDYRLTDSLITSYYFAQLQDYYRQHYVGVTHNTSLGDGKLSTDLRYFDSTSYGANRRQQAGYAANGFNNDGRVDNRAASALFTYGLNGHNIGLGYQHLSGSSNFPFINNGGGGHGATAYLITDSQISKFLRAGERTWVLRYGYDFTQAGIPGLRASATYLRADKVKTSVPGANTEWERNLWVGYSIQEGLFRNVGLALRHASLRSNVVGQRDQDELRIYISYNIALF